MTTTRKRRAAPCILGLDPGTNNFAYSVFRMDGVSADNPKGAFLESGMIQCTIRSLTKPSALSAERHQFKGALNEILGRHDVRIVIAERYMLRRGSGGTSIESINLMLGILLEYELPTKMIPASQWKNAAARAGYTLEEWYEFFKGERTVHEVDASSIALYGACSLHHVPYSLAPLETLSTATHLMVGASTAPPRKKAKKRRARSR